MLHNQATIDSQEKYDLINVKMHIQGVGFPIKHINSSNLSVHKAQSAGFPALLCEVIFQEVRILANLLEIPVFLDASLMCHDVMGLPSLTLM